MRYYHPTLCKDHYPIEVNYAFETGFDLLVLGDSESVKGDNTNSTIYNTLDQLAPFVKTLNRTLRHQPENNCWLAGAWGFSNTSTFIVYAYLLWKRVRFIGKEKFHQEFHFINSRVVVTLDDGSSTTLGDWFYTCKKNRTNAVLEIFSIILGPLYTCWFDNSFIRLCIEESCRENIMYVRPGRDMVDLSSLGHEVRDALTSLKKFYRKMFWLGLSCYYYRDPDMTNEGPLKRGSVLRDMKFDIVTPILSAHHIGEPLTELKEKELRSKFGLSCYPGDIAYDLDPMLTQTRVPTGGEGYLSLLEYHERFSKYSILPKIVDEPTPHTFMVTLNSGMDVFIGQQKVRDMVTFVSKHGGVVKVTVSKLKWFKKPITEIIGDVNHLEALGEALRPLSRIYIMGIFINDLSKINLFKIKGLDIGEIYLNVQRVPEAVEELKKYPSKDCIQS